MHHLCLHKHRTTTIIRSTNIHKHTKIESNLLPREDEYLQAKENYIIIDEILKV